MVFSLVWPQMIQRGVFDLVMILIMQNVMAMTVTQETQIMVLHSKLSILSGEKIMAISRG